MRSKKAIINIISSLLLQIVTLICGFIVPKLIISNFGSKINGLITSITQFLAYITFLESGIGPVIKAALYKPIANKNKKQIENILKSSERFFRFVAGIFVVYLLILSLLYPLILNNEFEFSYTMSLVLIISISTFAEYYFGMTYRLYLQSEQKTFVISIIQMLCYILNTITIVIMVKCNCSIQIIKLVSGLIFVLRPLLQNIYVKKKYNIRLKDADSKYVFKQKWDGLAQHIASVIHDNTDIVVLTICSTISEVSVYSVYFLVVRGIKAISQSFILGISDSFGDMIAKNEITHLKKSFKIYEQFYFTINSIIYICTIILIVPFIEVYTLGIKDVNYIRPTFGILLVLSEFIWTIRQPYNELVKVAGHFKETRKGAWMEAISNIVISMILVWKYGIVGVAIGTLVAMIFRTIEFMYHTNKYILRREHKESIKRMGIVLTEILIVAFSCKFLPKTQMISYFEWTKYACAVLLMTLILVLPLNIIAYKEDTKNLIMIIRSIIKRKKENEETI